MEWTQWRFDKSELMTMYDYEPLARAVWPTASTRT